MSCKWSFIEGLPGNYLNVVDSTGLHMPQSPEELDALMALQWKPLASNVILHVSHGSSIQELKSGFHNGGYRIL